MLSCWFLEIMQQQSMGIYSENNFLGLKILLKGIIGTSVNEKIFFLGKISISGLSGTFIREMPQ